MLCVSTALFSKQYILGHRGAHLELGFDPWLDVKMNKCDVAAIYISRWRRACGGARVMLAPHPRTRPPSTRGSGPSGRRSCGQSGGAVRRTWRTAAPSSATCTPQWKQSQPCHSRRRWTTVSASQSRTALAPAAAAASCNHAARMGFVFVGFGGWPNERGLTEPPLCRHHVCRARLG
jgi:hypothetical protein